MAAAAAPETDLRAIAAAARPDAFVCYAREDKAVAEQIAAGLVARGKEVWVDWEDIPFSAPWEDRARAGIEAAKAVVVVLSGTAAVSEPCRWEVEQAIGANKRLVPIAISDDVDPSRLPPALAQPNWIPAVDRALEGALDTLVETLDTDLEWRDEHARLLVRAVDWQRRGRDGSFLLRGSDLRNAEDWISRQGEHQQRATPLQGEYIVASRRAAARRQRITFMFVLIALAVAVGLAAVALWQRGVAIENERLAVENARQSRSRELAATAVAQLQGDPELALLLAIEAARVAPTSQAGEALRAALARAHAAGRGALRHDGLTAVAVTPDGKLAITASTDATARVWNVDRGRSSAVLRGHAPGGFAEGARGIWAAAVSDDSRTSVTAGLDGTARVWNMQTGEPVAKLDVRGGAVLAVALAPDGSRVATGSEDGTLRTWDVATGRELAAVRESESWVMQVAFSPDGSLVAASGTDSGGAVLRDATTLRPRARLAAGHVSELVFSAGGRSVATGSFGGTARVWDTATGAERAVVDGHGEFGVEVAFTPDGKRIASAGTAGTVKTWEVATGRVLFELRHPGEVGDVAFSADGRYLATAGGNQTARVWDAATGRLLRELRGHRQPVWFVAFLPGDRLATAGADGTVRVWSALPERTTTELRAHTAVVNDVALAPDGSVVATASADSTARIWDARTGHLRATLARHDDDVTGARFSPNGRLLVTLGGDDARLWDARTGRLRSMLRGETGWRAAFTPDSRHLVTASGRIWNVPTGRVVATIGGLGSVLLPTLVLRPDGKAVFAAPVDGPPAIFDVPSGRRVLAFRDHPEAEVRAAFSADGETIAVDDGTRIALWDATTGQRTRQLPRGLTLIGSTALAATLPFSRDGSLLLTVTRAGVRVLDVRSGRSVADLPHPRGVGDAEFSPDGRLVLTAGWDGAVRVWETRTGRLITRLVGRSSEEWSEGFMPVVAFSTRGWRVVTATGGRTAFVHACPLCAPLPDLLALARRTVTRSLTPDERETYLVDSGAPA